MTCLLIKHKSFVKKLSDIKKNKKKTATSNKKFKSGGNKSVVRINFQCSEWWCLLFQKQKENFKTPCILYEVAGG